MRYHKPNIPDKSIPFIIKEFEEILRGGWVSNGKNVSRLEQIFKTNTGCKYAIACSNATTGLTIAIKAAGWKNKRVLLPAFTWPSTLYAITCNGNTPVYGDISKSSWTLKNPEIDLSNFDYVVPVDTFGKDSSKQLQNIDPSRVIYDAAHGWKLKNLGQRGLAEVVSLSFTKPVTAMEGGIILTNDEALAKKAIELRRLAGRMEEVNALVAIKSIDSASYYQTKEEEVAEQYTTRFINYDQLEPIKLPTTYALAVRDPALRVEIQNNLEASNIEVKNYYEPLVKGLPFTDTIYERILCLPCYADMTTEDIERICSIVEGTIETYNCFDNHYTEESDYVKKYIQ